MNLKLYNTETREKESIVAKEGFPLKLYTCGPTIYHFAHIGNFRTYVAEDLLRRTLKFFGFSVEQAMNLTDIDDKTIRGALAQNTSLKTFTDPFKKAFFEDISTLNIEKAEHYPAATSYIGEMIQMIEQLMSKGFAYQSSNGSVYYAVKQFPSYGRLSHFCLDELKVNASGDNLADEYEKDEMSDFVLWKAYDINRDGDMFWDSPFGKGRPGWHIECSAMAMTLLGPHIDIHCGGVDNMFPHHENEIAQSEGCSGHQFVRHWMHVEHLLVDHKKMSKSLGNFYTLRDLQKQGWSGIEVRYLLLSTHYRTQLNFTLEGLQAARASLGRIQDCLARIQRVQQSSSNGSALVYLKQAEFLFQESLADDLNISSALAAMFDLIREIHICIDDKQLSHVEGEQILQTFLHWDQVLGLSLFQEEEIPAELLGYLEERNEARKVKNFQRSDEIRDLIDRQGYIIEDTPEGPRLKRK